MEGKMPSSLARTSSLEAFPLLKEDAPPHPVSINRRLCLLAIATGLLIAAVYHGPGFVHDTSLAASDKLESSSASQLTVEVSNEYGIQDNFTYPFLMGREDPTEAILIEPHRDTTLTVRHSCSACSHVWKFPTLRMELSGGTVVTRVNTTGTHDLILCEAHNGVSTRTRKFVVYVKYVRRELRGLTSADREEFMVAASTLWKVSTVDGRSERYGFGDKYFDIYYFAILHNDLAGNGACDFLHGTEGYAFLNAHSALNLMFERSIQAVNPRFALPYWDYVFDSETYSLPHGADNSYMNIWNSDVFTSSYYGSTDSLTGVVQDGAWAGIHVPILTQELVDNAGITGHFRKHGFGSCHGQVADVCNTKTAKELFQYNASTLHQANAFGRLRSPWNMNSGKELIRSQQLCGSPNDNQFPDCTSLTDQYVTYDSFGDYTIALQLSPHGSIHVFTGGAFGDCSDSVPALSDVFGNEDFFGQFNAKLADLTKDLWMEGLKKCPRQGSCEGKEQSECSCSCPSVDITALKHQSLFELKNTSVWKFVEPYLSTDSTSEYIDEITHLVVLSVLDTVCNTEVLLGDMYTSNSPLDVLFFSTHSNVERMFHQKMLSGTMSNLRWPSTTPVSCPGGKAKWRNLWFDYEFDDKSIDSSLLTNDQFLSMLNPLSPHHAHQMNYIFDTIDWPYCGLENNSSLPTLYIWDLE